MSGPAARIQAQAKLNLYLRILTREQSGYHSIETIFHRVELADEVVLHVEEDELRTIDVQGAEVGPAESNLAWRTALAYQNQAGWRRRSSNALERTSPA